MANGPHAVSSSKQGGLYKRLVPTLSAGLLPFPNQSLETQLEMANHPLGTLGILPAELLLEVFTYIFGGQEVRVTFTAQRRMPPEERKLSYMTVCKAFNNCAVPVLYRVTTFYFPTPFNDLPVFLLQLSDKAFNAIRSLKIQFNPPFPREGLNLLLACNSLQKLEFECCSKAVGISVMNQRILRSFRLQAFDWKNYTNSDDSVLREIKNIITSDGPLDKWQEKQSQQTREDKVSAFHL